MRIVRGADDLGRRAGRRRREAQTAFGDDRLILERLLEGPRHVEVQLLFDAHGNGVHLGERDCSAQRRQQKILEEAPAPSVTHGCGRTWETRPWPWRPPRATSGWARPSSW